MLGQCGVSFCIMDDILLSLFNAVLSSMNHPAMWCYAKLVLISKSDGKMVCDSYCGSLYNGHTGKNLRHIDL